MTEAFDPQSDDGQIDGTVPDVVAIQEFRDARDLLLAHGGDYEAAYRDFRWPRLETFNWKVDWFDGVLAAEQPGQRRKRVDQQVGHALQPRKIARAAVHRGPAKHLIEHRFGARAFNRGALAGR